MSAFADEVRLGLTTDIYRFTSAATRKHVSSPLSQAAEARFIRMAEGLKAQIGDLAGFAEDYVDMSGRIAMPAINQTLSRLSVRYSTPNHGSECYLS